MEFVPIPQTQGRGQWRVSSVNYESEQARDLGDRRTEALSTSQPAKERKRTGNTNGWRGLRKGERGSG